MTSYPAPPPPPGYGAYPGGYPPPPPQPYSGYTPPPTGPRNGLGVAALVTAIVALFSVVGGVVLGVVAIILGFLGRGRASRGEATNGGVAVAGIVLGVLSIIEAVVVIGLTVWVINKAGGTDYYDCVSKAGSDDNAIQQCADQFTDRVEKQFSITVTPTPAP
jgi:heme/copper-type cytochrome/quinol oxidase subunit 2